MAAWQRDSGLVIWPSVALIMPFAGWLASRHTTAPDPPTEDPTRRTLGVLLLGIGATLVLLGAAFALLGLGFTYDQARKDPTAVLTLPLFFIPLVVGHGVMYSGAGIRAPRKSSALGA